MTHKTLCSTNKSSRYAKVEHISFACTCNKDAQAEMLYIAQGTDNAH